MSTNADAAFDKQNTDTDALKVVPVVKDEVPVEQPNDARNPDSDQALEQDEKEAIDKGNILKGGRTRGATKPEGTYQDPEGEDDLPADDGTSAVR
ncbi:hypothetical protein LTR41_011789 [Exophiala xenobiotica]|nr:hypothetical protein LTR41_011789 [Exophiala xenobiotica]KAK5550353.1 hypothetical protein LTR46_011640 [Exophiala xenobiotica]